MIRHTRLLLTAAAPVLTLAVTMIESPFATLLVAPVGAPPLLETGLFAAWGAAVAVSAVTMRADEEHPLATLTKAKSLPQNRFAMNHRHASSPAGLDNGSGFVAGWSQLCLVYLSNGCRTRNPAAVTAGFHLFPAFETRYFVQPSLWMIGRMTAPSAR